MDRGSMQEEIFYALETLREVQGHLNNIQLRAFELEEEVGNLISCNLRLLESLKQDELETCSDGEPAAPSTPHAPSAPWKTSRPKNGGTMPEKDTEDTKKEV